MTLAPSVVDRFWAMVDTSGECWTWTGATARGYGLMTLRGLPRLRKAHRLSWEIHNGPIPDGLFCLHHCDNPPCVRPDHLYLGTNSDNIRDAYRRGLLAQPHVARTHCMRGHPFTPENTYVWPDRSRRQCRICERARASARVWHQKHEAVQLSLTLDVAS